jgi:hypothetical protein
MKRTILMITILLSAFFFTSSHPAFAAMSEITILNKTDIAKLSDAQLLDTYVDILVELEASKSFHVTSGFTPKSYNEYKDLIRYRINLLMEIHKRGLETPPVDK